MDYRTVGRTGVKVSNLCFGTMSFGDTADESESAQLFGAARDAGITFFDCANVYAGAVPKRFLASLYQKSATNSY